ASGTGKSTLALQLVAATLAGGGRALLVSFEESRRNFRRRAAGIGLDVEAWLDSGALAFVHVDPAETSAGEISDMVRGHVANGVRAVILDSLTGYQHALRDENYLLLHMHELLAFLNQKGVATILVLAQAGIVGMLEPPFDMTYLADTVLMLRYFEAGGSVRRLISVVKKRTGEHEHMPRELFFDRLGVRVGLPLTSLHGLLDGRPRHSGDEPLLAARTTTDCESAAPS
ncbi:MAG: AAA family ATPase, partial [Sandarakinorhabdus sp.]|nr:AAA family ATPase [Sandarakinorhabdus sp.]